MDEVYCEQKVQYCGGQLYGTHNDEVTKTLLCVMVKSVAGNYNYNYIVSMNPITNINSDKLYKIWMNVLKFLTEIGFDILVTMVDGHSSNIKFYKILLREPLDFSIPENGICISNPFSPAKKIYLMFDPVHLFKKFYTNFLNYEEFDFPLFEYCCKEDTSEVKGKEYRHASFAHIKQLYDIEICKQERMAHKLTKKLLQPSSIEKVNVMLADACFHESTINALKCYASHGYPHFSGTAAFLQIIRNWFNVVNVKSFFSGQQKMDERREAITTDTRENQLGFLKEFYRWLEEWEFSQKKGLSSPTFLSAKTTTLNYMPLVKYLLDEKQLSYVLLGFISSDYLEGRYGWYRQLCGANYFNSVLQFLQAEKCIRIRCLIKMGFTISEIKDIFETSQNIIDDDPKITTLVTPISSLKFDSISITESDKSSI